MSLLLLFLISSSSEAEVDVTDSNFLLTPIQSSSGLGLSILHTSQSVQPVCVTSQSVNDLPLLAHSVCVSSKFTTYKRFSLVNLTDVNMKSQAQLSSINCTQSSSYQTTCSNSISEGFCEFLISIDCGSCHPHIQLSPNSTIILESPLYPVLQPDMICQYDLELDEEVAADISIVIDDLNLAPPQLTHSHEDGGHCISSYLHILSGTNMEQMDSIAMLCGDARQNTITLQRQNMVKLQLVSGNKVHARYHRGFRLTIIVSPSVDPTAVRMIAITSGSVLGFALVVGILVTISILHRKWKAQKRKRQPRRGVTWHGSAPVSGHSLHMDRTQHITRQLDRVEEGEDTRENLYGSLDYGDAIYRYRSIRALRTLPEAPRPESITSEPNPEEESNKIYETFENSSSSSDTDTAHRSRCSAKKAPGLPLPCVPSRPSWTLQPPPGETQPEISPMYLCFPHRDETEQTYGQISREILTGECPEVESESKKYESVSIFKISKDSLSNATAAPKTSLRQSLLSLTDNMTSRFRMSLSDQSSRINRLLSPQREDTLGEVHLLEKEGEDEDLENDEVFY